MWVCTFWNIRIRKRFTLQFLNGFPDCTRLSYSCFSQKLVWPNSIIRDFQKIFYVLPISSLPQWAKRGAKPPGVASGVNRDWVWFPAQQKFKIVLVVINGNYTIIRWTRLRFEFTNSNFLSAEAIELNKNFRFIDNLGLTRLSRNYFSFCVNSKATNNTFDNIQHWQIGIRIDSDCQNYMLNL